MQASALELFTTRELVDELMRRTTFLGVVVHSEQNYRGTWQGERTFQVHFNSNLDATQAGRLLDAVAASMARPEY
jgi:hypothetical protein